MDERAPKLDLILDSISKYEESIMQQMRRAREAQEELAQARTETAKMKEAAAQLEGMIAARQALSDELEAQLEEKRRANEGLQSGCHVILNQLWQEQEMNDILEEEIEARTEALVEATADFVFKVRLNDPQVPRRYSALQQELRHLDLEATRLMCEIKVREDNEHEVETLRSVKKEHEEEWAKLESHLAERENILRMQLEEAKSEREKLMEPENDPRIQRMKLELSSLREEQDYLKSALISMKQEHETLKCRPREERPYQPGNVLSSSRRGSSYHQNNQSFSRSDKHSSTSRLYSRRDERWTVSAEDSRVTGWTQQGDNPEDHRVVASNSGWKGTSDGKQGESSSSNCDSWNRGKQGYGKVCGRGKSTQDRNWPFDKSGPTSSRSRVKPSTPRTFTRNPPPLTPQPQTNISSNLPLHMLGHFSIIGKVNQDNREECNSREDPHKTTKDSSELVDNSFGSNTSETKETNLGIDSPAYVPTDVQNCASSSQPETTNIEEITKTKPQVYEENANFSDAEQIPLLVSDEGSAWVAAPEMSSDAYNAAPRWASTSSSNQPRAEKRDSYSSQNQRGKLHFKYQKKTVLCMENPDHKRMKESKKRYSFHHTSASSQRGYQNYCDDPPASENLADNNHTYQDPSSSGDVPPAMDPFDNQFSWSDLKNLEHFS
ncbi:serine/arginine repetitive matrix protein 4-like isoform X2 [Penaeus indicus]|uniref:serine/arginine repetitive matrix protein 4-like isoform X2 n=1 Tax=Penaeus indicus TaxID=29960 RepID=UPI00300C0535